MYWLSFFIKIFFFLCFYWCVIVLTIMKCSSEKIASFVYMWVCHEINVCSTWVLMIDNQSCVTLWRGGGEGEMKKDSIWLLHKGKGRWDTNEVWSVEDGYAVFLSSFSMGTWEWKEVVLWTNVKWGFWVWYALITNHTFTCNYANVVSKMIPSPSSPIWTHTT